MSVTMSKSAVSQILRLHKAVDEAALGKKYYAVQDSVKDPSGKYCSVEYTESVANLDRCNEALVAAEVANPTEAAHASCIRIVEFCSAKVIIAGHDMDIMAKKKARDDLNTVEEISLWTAVATSPEEVRNTCADFARSKLAKVNELKSDLEIADVVYREVKAVYDTAVVSLGKIEGAKAKYMDIYFAHKDAEEKYDSVTRVWRLYSNNFGRLPDPFTE